MQMTHAATIIQRAWRAQLRYNTTAAYARQIRGCRISAEHARSLDIASLNDLLRKKPVVHAAKYILQRFHMLSLYRHGFPLDLPMEGAHRVSVRIFLTAFVISTHAEQMFQSPGPRHDAAIAAARRLTRTFDLLVSTACAGVALPPHLTAPFIRSLIEYNLRFLELNLPMNLVKRMEIAAAIRQLVGSDDPYAEKQIKRLHALLNETAEH